MRRHSLLFILFLSLSLFMNPIAIVDRENLNISATKFKNHIITFNTCIYFFLSCVSMYYGHISLREKRFHKVHIFENALVTLFAVFTHGEDSR